LNVFALSVSRAWFLGKGMLQALPHLIESALGTLHTRLRSRKVRWDWFKWLKVAMVLISLIRIIDWQICFSNAR